jgi:hypothetical protein
MSLLSRLRKKWNYETNVPRCATCAEYLPARVYLKRDSIPIQAKPLCKAGHFHVAPLACCDKWHRPGETLA